MFETERPAMSTKATETRIPCSKETRRLLSGFKQSPDNWDTTLQRVARLARDAKGQGGEASKQER